MKWFAGIFVCCLILVSACSDKKDKSEGNADMAATQELASDSAEFKKDTKLDEINDAIVADPKNPEHYHDRAYYYFHNKEFDMAIRDVKKCIEMEPNSAKYYFSKGFMFHAALKLKEAETAFQQCLERDPEYVDAHFFLAKIYQALASPQDVDKFNYTKAREAINEALKIDETRADLYFLRGTIYEELGDSGAALGSYKTAIELDPDFYDSFVRMGLLYASKGNPKAEVSYKSALTIQPNSTESLFGLAKYYQDIGEYDLAEMNYKRVIEVDSFYAIAYLNLGYMYMTFDTAYSKALEYLHKAIYFNSGSFLPLTYFNAGVAYELQEKYGRARKYYNAALTKDENYRPAIDALDDLDRRGLGLEETD